MGSATIVVQFGSESGGIVDGHLSAEIDSRDNGLNGGKTSFAPGDTVAILVYKTDNVTLDGVEASAGSVAAGETVTVSVTDDLVFANEDTATLRLPASGTPSVVWLGRDLGAVALQADKMTVKAATKGIGVAQATYSTTAQVFRLASPASIAGLTDFSIVVVVSGHSA